MKIPKKLRITLGVMCLVKAKSEQKQMKCNQEDTTGTFIVDGKSRRCLWAKRHRYSRCEIDIVRTNCPKTCDAPCISDEYNSQPQPTNTPSSATPESTNRPSSAITEPSSSDISVTCEDEDNLEDVVLSVNGEERSCLWAKRLKDDRCTIDLVQEKCPSTCSVPCTTSTALDPVLDKDKASDQMDGGSPIVVIPATSEGPTRRMSASLLTLLLTVCWVIALF